MYARAHIEIDAIFCVQFAHKAERILTKQNYKHW